MTEKNKKNNKKESTQNLGNEHFVVYNFGLQSLYMGPSEKFIIKGRNVNYGNIGATVFNEQTFDELSKCMNFNEYLKSGVLDTKRIFGGDELDRDLMYYTSDQYLSILEEEKTIITPALNDEKSLVHEASFWSEDAKNDPNKQVKIFYNGKEINEAIEENKRGLN